VAIAGHRTTYGAPFRNVDRLERGDRIELRMPYGRLTYAVERTRIVRPTELSVIDRVAFDRLVLSACHPLYSAAKRIIVFARLQGAR
jgi:sortase A